VHPVTGEGIHYALWSAELATQAIAISDLRLYDSLWRQEYGKELISGGKKSKVFCKPDTLDNIVQFAGKSSVFANIILDLYTGCLEISRAEKRILLKTPKILLETAAALISAAVS
jgi:flavin-dependent dehydrogenase